MSLRVQVLFWGSRQLTAPGHNGIGRYIPQLERITLKFCKSSGTSQGVREFISEDLLDFSRKNPSVAIYLKPRRRKSPIYVADYSNGDVDYYSLHNSLRDTVRKYMELLKWKSYGPAKPVLDTINTFHPSVQGPWTPFTNKHSATLAKDFPIAELSEVIVRPSATDIVLEKFKQQQNIIIEEESLKN